MLSKKKRQAQAAEAARTEADLRQVNRDLLYKLHEYEKRWKSPDGVRVLNDLQDALNLIREYQRYLHLASFADPSHNRANALLKSWGMNPYSTPDQGGTVSQPGQPPKEETLEEKLAREEKEWGEEAYGSGTVRMELEAIDEGDAKEPGYTRARVRFVDVTPEEPDYEGEQVDTKWDDYPSTDTRISEQGE